MSNFEVKTIFDQKPDVEVFFEFNGARTHPASDGYRPNHLVKDDYLTTGVHHYYDVTQVASDGNAKGTITFLSPEAYPSCLWVGRRINIQEGEKIVGNATILKIFNPILVAQEPIKSIFDQDPDVEVFFRFNGTKKSMIYDGYRPNHIIDNYLITGLHRYYGMNKVSPKGKATGTISFLSPEKYPSCLWVGKKIRIQNYPIIINNVEIEDARIVGEATIIRIMNPILEARITS